MMFVSSVRLKGRPDKYKEISQTITSITDQTKSKKGCLASAGYQDINNRNIFYLVEEWQTQRDMNEYLNSRLFAALLGIKTLLAEKPQVKTLIEENFNDSSKKN